MEEGLEGAGGQMATWGVQRSGDFILSWWGGRGLSVGTTEGQVYVLERLPPAAGSHRGQLEAKS